MGVDPHTVENPCITLDSTVDTSQMQIQPTSAGKQVLLWVANLLLGM